jgi:hypothetical protein
VRDAKHPRHKEGNHQRFRYTQKSWEIVECQPDSDPFIFPYDPRGVSSAFTEACHVLGIPDLHFHDLRHEAISRLFEQGYDLHDVPLISLHMSWDELKRYANLRPEALREIVTLPDGKRVIRISDIVAENCTALEPPQSSVGCITNTPRCRPVRNRIIADYSRFCSAAAPQHSQRHPGKNAAFRTLRI